jgi:hypothetical protein
MSMNMNCKSEIISSFSNVVLYILRIDDPF